MTESAPRAEPDSRRWWALALLCGAFYMVILDAAIVTVALPSIKEELGFTTQGLQWVVSAYALTFAGLLLLGGRAADLLGRRRVFMAGLVLFTLASLLCGLAWSDRALIGARAVQGIGAAVMTPTALSIITTTFEEGAERNKALGIWGALGGIGATTAWLIGGPIVDGLGWEWIFFINIPVGLAALALSPRCCARAQRRPLAEAMTRPARSPSPARSPCSCTRSWRHPARAGRARRRSSCSPARRPCSRGSRRSSPATGHHWCRLASSARGPSSARTRSCSSSACSHTGSGSCSPSTPSRCSATPPSSSGSPRSSSP